MIPPSQASIYVKINIFLHSNSTEGDGENTRHVENFGGQVGQVCHSEDKQGLQYCSMVSKPEYIFMSSRTGMP